MKTLGVILLSVGLNVALLYLNARVFFSPPPPAVAAPVVGRVVTNTVWRVERAAAPQPPPPTNPPPHLTFHWREIESPEYPAYIANLRKFDCPERTIQNIILADVTKSFETRAAELEDRDLDPFWQSGSAKFARERERLARARALDDESARLLQQLLGIDPAGDPRLAKTRGESVDAFTIEHALFYSQLPPEKREAAIRLWVRHETQGQLLEGDARITGLRADTETRRLQSEEREAELRKILSADELAEIRYRVAAFWLKYAGLELTAAELRSLAQIVAGASGPFSLLDRPEKKEPSTGSVDPAIEKLLGSQRFPDYQRAQDYRFERMLSFTQENGLPKLNAVRAYDIHTDAERAAAEIRNDDSLTVAEANRQLRELQATTTGRLNLELSATLAEKYFQAEGAWVKDLARPLARAATKPASAATTPPSTASTPAPAAPNQPANP